MQGNVLFFKFCFITATFLPDSVVLPLSFCRYRKNFTIYRGNTAVVAVLPATAVLPFSQLPCHSVLHVIKQTWQDHVYR